MSNPYTMKQALEALEAALSDDLPYIDKSKVAITALRQALEQQPADEPVAKVIRNESGQISMQKPDGTYFDMSKHIGQTLYTTPQTAAQASRQMKDTIVDIIKTSNTLSEAFNAIAALPIIGEDNDQ